MTSQNSLLLYQLVDVLKWCYTFISVDILVSGFHAIMVYVLAWCFHVIAWRHDVTKSTTWRQETNCLHLSLQMCSRANSIFVSVISLVAELNLVIVIVFERWNNVTKWRHDVIKHAVPISACRRAREMILFFCFYSILGCQVQKYHRFCICICGHVIKWRYDVMAWLYDVTKLTSSILVCGVAIQMIRCPCIHGCLDNLITKCRYLIRKCHSISTGMMTSLYAVTSWSWRLVTISQISFHSS